MKILNKIFVYVILIFIFLSFSSSCYADQENDLTIYSDCILMVEKETGDILYEKNANERMYPASTTKTLTAIVVLEHCSLNEIATVSSSAVKSVPPSYTICNIVPRRKIKS